MVTTQLIQPRDAEDYRRLLVALGSENNPSQWLEFMDTMNEVLPEILSAGRPSKSAIQSCLIGRMGFDSWKAMIEAPTAQGGLGWSVSGWNSFRRAYRVVSQHPYLRDKNLRSGWINKYAHQWGEDFPTSSEAFDARVEAEAENSREQRKRKHEQELDALRAQVEMATCESNELIVELSQARSEIEHQKGQIANLSKQASEAAKAHQEIGAIKKEAQTKLAEKRQRIEELEAQIGQAANNQTQYEQALVARNAEVHSLKQELQAQPKSFWPLLRAAFASLQAKP